MTNKFSRWCGNLRVLSLVTDARSTLSQLFISFVVPPPHTLSSFASLTLIPYLVLLSRGRMKAAQPVLGSGKGRIRSQVSESRKAQILSLRSDVVMRSHSWDIWHTPCKYFCRINSTCDNLLSSPFVNTVTSCPFLLNRDLVCFLFIELCIYSPQRNPDDFAV